MVLSYASGAWPQTSLHTSPLSSSNDTHPELPHKAAVFCGVPCAQQAERGAVGRSTDLAGFEVITSWF